MRGVVAVGAVLLVSLALSGCFVSKDDAKTDSAAIAEGSRATATNTTAARPAASNATGPTANLTASPSNGTAPLNVTFHVAGSVAAGHNATWTLAIGNASFANGTALPANVTHAFTEAGNHTVVLVVSDGRANATANVTIQVIAGNATGAAPHEDKWATFNADGTCDAKGEFSVPGGRYIHERGSPPGTGYVAGDGTWIYEESNGIAGLQLGGPDEDAAYTGCVNPDTLVF